MSLVKTFTMYSDPGHGWLQVSVRDVRAAGLHARDFSVYSYAAGRGDDATYYLEEDCDAPKFVAAWKDKVGAIRFDEKHSDKPSFVRGLRSL